MGNSSSDLFMQQSHHKVINHHFQIELHPKLSNHLHSCLNCRQINKYYPTEQQPLLSEQDLTSAIDEWLGNQEDAASDNFDDLLTQSELVKSLA